MVYVPCPVYHLFHSQRPPHKCRNLSIELCMNCISVFTAGPQLSHWGPSLKNTTSRSWTSADVKENQDREMTHLPESFDVITLWRHRRLDLQSYRRAAQAIYRLVQIDKKLCFWINGNSVGGCHSYIYFCNQRTVTKIVVKVTKVKMQKSKNPNF